MKESQFHQELLTHSSFLKGIAMKLSNNSGQAEDLVQDTIFRALTNQEKFHGGNLKAWLATIMRNLFINGIRSAKRRKLINSPNGTYVLMEPSKISNNLAEGKMMIEEVESEIDKLHPDLKTPFVMRYQGYKYDEIAQQLDAPVGTIKSRIHLARKNLIRRLGTMYGAAHFAELAA